LKFFEWGKTYQKTQDGYLENKVLSVLICGEVYHENWSTNHQPDAFFYFKGVLEQLLQKNTNHRWNENTTQNDLFSEGLSYGFDNEMVVDFGFIDSKILQKFDINQDVLYAEIDFKTLGKWAKDNTICFNEIHKFPTVRRDFALLLNQSVPFGQLKEIAHQTEKKILTKVELFDVYEGDKLPKGKKSYGLSFYFQDPKKTLTDTNIDKIMDKLQKQFETQVGAELRS
jgi:phenylalanyl-tRNA synthetase beta chain